MIQRTNLYRSPIEFNRAYFQVGVYRVAGFLCFIFKIIFLCTRVEWEVYTEVCNLSVYTPVLEGKKSSTTPAQRILHYVWLILYIKCKKRPHKVPTNTASQLFHSLFHNITEQDLVTTSEEIGVGLSNQQLIEMLWGNDSTPAAKSREGICDNNVLGNYLLLVWY